MSSLFSVSTAPFMIALILMLSIGALEMFAMLVGVSLIEPVDDLLSAHVDFESGDGFLYTVLGWLHLGKVPALVVLILFLMGFSLTGLVLQWGVLSLFGYFLPVIVAVVIAAFAGFYFTRSTGGMVAKYIPKIETSAVSTDSFIGKIAVVTGIDATYGKASEAKLTDEFKLTHYIYVEPDEEGMILKRGEKILLISQINSTTFRAIPNPNPDLL